MNYTKGIWEVSQHGITYPVICGTYQVAEGIYRKANAQLISAAPSMYEALRDIVAECPNPKLPYGKRIVEIAQEALAKAEGK